MLSEIARPYGPTRTTSFNTRLFVTNFRGDTAINWAVFKRENFGTGKQISASHKGQFFVFFVVVVVVVVVVSVVCVFVKV